MKKRLPLINIISICFLAALLIISAFNCIRIMYYASPFTMLDEVREPVVEYENALSVILTILICLQVVFWFFNRKVVRITGIVMSSMTMIIYVFLPFGVYVENKIYETISDSYMDVKLLPAGYVLIGISAVVVILTVMSLLRMNKATTRTG